MRTLMLLLVLVLTGAGVVRGDQDDARLIPLFAELRTASTPRDAQALESRIWRIWIDSDQDEVDRLMTHGIRAMAGRDLEVALALFDKVVELAPDFAEGWNKRATVYYLMDNYPASILDIRHTLELEPRHFGALSGMGLIFMALGDPLGALRAFEEVLKIHPQAPSARAHAEGLRASLRNETI